MTSWPQLTLAAENETMSQIEVCLHDVYHSMARLRQSFPWLLPDGARSAQLSPSFPGLDGEWFAPPLALPRDWLAACEPALRAQIRFHARVFAALRGLPDRTRAGAELVWFSFYRADERQGDATMTPSGLRNMLMGFSPRAARELSAKARSGGFGARYAGVDEATLLQSASALRELARSER